MLNDHIIYQSHLIHFKKTFYGVCNLKKNSKPSPPLLNPPSKHTLSLIVDIAILDYLLELVSCFLTFYDFGPFIIRSSIN